MEEPKYTLTIESEDINELTVALRAKYYYAILWEILHNGKRSFKYSEESEDFHKGVEAAFEKIHEIIGDENLDLLP